jgi:hypothetical protein
MISADSWEVRTIIVLTLALALVGTYQALVLVWKLGAEIRRAKKEGR